jgi:hypothetical protein
MSGTSTWLGFSGDRKIADAITGEATRLAA